MSSNFTTAQGPCVVYAKGEVADKAERGEINEAQRNQKKSIKNQKNGSLDNTLPQWSSFELGLLDLSLSSTLYLDHIYSTMTQQKWPFYPPEAPGVMGKKHWVFFWSEFWSQPHHYGSNSQFLWTSASSCSKEGRGIRISGMTKQRTQLTLSSKIANCWNLYRIII